MEITTLREVCQSEPLAAKWLMSVGMLIGRLEIFTVLVLFVPRFWAN